jgi:hypothetical protein
MTDVAYPPAGPNKGQGLTTTRRFTALNGNGVSNPATSAGIESGWQLWHANGAAVDTLEPGDTIADDVAYVFAGVNQHFVANGDAGTAIVYPSDCYLRVGANVTAGALLYPATAGEHFTTVLADAVSFDGDGANKSPCAVALESVTYAEGITEHVLASLFPTAFGKVRFVAGGGG